MWRRPPFVFGMGEAVEDHHPFVTEFVLNYEEFVSIEASLWTNPGGPGSLRFSTLSSLIRRP